MFNFFKKKPKTIYGQVLEGVLEGEENPGLMELEVMTGKRTLEPAATDLLDAAILEYFAGEWDSISKIQGYFRHNLALEAIPNFENWLYGFDRMDRPMLGLSILLMRDSEVLEAVKFGIYLSIYYDLRQSPGALKIVENLVKDPHFTYYALESALKAPQGTVLFYDLGQDLKGRAKEIFETRARILLEGLKEGSQGQSDFD